VKGGAYVVLFVLVLVLLLGGADVVVSTIVNGTRIGPKTQLSDDGLIQVDPQQLADDAGLGLDTYALARALKSEHGNDPDAYLVAVAWAIRNYAAERGRSVFQVITAGGNGAGFFGAQNARAGTKYVSSAQDPDERHVTVAVHVLGDQILDPTGGATHFYSPKAQDALAARAESGYGRDAAAVDAAWRAPGGLYAEGAVPVVPPGVDGHVLTLYRRAV